MLLQYYQNLIGSGGDNYAYCLSNFLVLKYKHIFDNVLKKHSLMVENRCVENGDTECMYCLLIRIFFVVVKNNYT